MKTQKIVVTRRSRAQWAELVKAWEKSGETAAAFAAALGLKPQTLSWWKWRLAARGRTEPTRSVDAEPEEMRLVPVRLTDMAASPDAKPAWEVLSARGDVLRVYAGGCSPELVAVVRALVREEER